MLIGDIKTNHNYTAQKKKGLYMFREEVAKIEELSERISKLRGSL
jgi:hypothetical protein